VGAFLPDGEESAIFHADEVEPSSLVVGDAATQEIVHFSGVDYAAESAGVHRLDEPEEGASRLAAQNQCQGSPRNTQKIAPCYLRFG
jgi:hypothetical protein